MKPFHVSHKNVLRIEKIVRLGSFNGIHLLGSRKCLARMRDSDSRHSVCAIITLTLDQH